jgi:hypothetical protein
MAEIDFSFLDDILSDDTDYSYMFDDVTDLTPNMPNTGIGSFDVNDLFGDDDDFSYLFDDNYNFTGYSGPGTASDQIGNYLDNMYDDESEFLDLDTFQSAMNREPGYEDMLKSFYENKGLGSIEDYLDTYQGGEDRVDYPKPGILDIIAGFFGADRKGGKSKAQGIMQTVGGGLTDFANSPIGQLLLANYLTKKDKEDRKIPLGAEAYGNQGLGSMPDYRIFNLQPALMPGVGYANAPPPEMKHGGLASMNEGPGDITLARLEPGEFVMTRKATDNIGAKNLYSLMKQAERMG